MVRADYIGTLVEYTDTQWLNHNLLLLKHTLKTINT